MIDSGANLLRWIAYGVQPFAPALWCVINIIRCVGSGLMGVHERCLDWLIRSSPFIAWVSAALALLYVFCGCLASLATIEPPRLHVSALS